jgi:hypothetical protein
MDVPVSDSPSAAKTAGILAGIARRRRPRYTHGPQNGVTTDTAVDSNVTCHVHRRRWDQNKNGVQFSFFARNGLHYPVRSVSLIHVRGVYG